LTLVGMASHWGANCGNATPSGAWHNWQMCEGGGTANATIIERFG
jgi:hypothetical protein